MTELRRPVPIDIEPKRKNRWIIEFPELDFAEWMVQSSSRPSMTMNDIEIPFVNTSTYVLGRAVWDTIDITFIDNIGPSTSQKVMEWIRQCVEFSTGRMGYASQYKKQLIIKMLDPAGITVEQWTLYGAMPINANFGDLDMGSDELAQVSITIRFDYAILNF